VEDNTNQATPPAEEATTIGMFLKYTRLKQKKSIEAASEALCIRKVYIKALEEDDYETLPPIPYGVGFVRSYAAYLGLNAQRIAQIYKQQAFPQKEKNTQTVVKEHTELTMPKKKQIYLGLLAIAVLYALWLSSSAISQKLTYSKTLSELSTQTIDIAPVNEEPSDEVIAEQIVTKEIVTDNTSADSQVTMVETSYTEEAQQVEEKPAEPVKDTLTLKFKGQSWIELKDGQKVYVSGIKNKGFTFETDVTDGMILSIGKYYNVDVYINGVLTTVAGPRKQTNIKLNQFIKH